MREIMEMGVMDENNWMDLMDAEVCCFENLLILRILNESNYGWTVLMMHMAIDDESDVEVITIRWMEG